MLVAVIAFLAFPAGSNAADFVSLTINPTSVAPGWMLSGVVESTATSTSGFGREDLKLRRTFLGGRGQEEHRLHADGVQNTIVFDGQTGRWQTARFGNTATADLSIKALATPVPVEVHGCTGAFARVPVRLSGTLSIRTGTRFFQTIRRTQLSGLVTFAQGKAGCESGRDVTCGPPSALALYADYPRTLVVAMPRRLTVEFQNPLPHPSPGEVAWHHVMNVSGYDARSGTLPRLTVRAPASSVVRGNARFLASEEGMEYEAGGCKTTVTSGTATGSFTATFAGWGARTARLEAGDQAILEEKR